MYKYIKIGKNKDKFSIYVIYAIIHNSQDFGKFNKK